MSDEKKTDVAFEWLKTARKEMENPEYGATLKGTKENWYKRASDMTLRTLPGFLAELAEHRHDYNSIVYAVAAAALAASHALDQSPNGDITGFQAGVVFWEFYGEWLHERGPARIVKFEDMLFPQYESRFQKTITSDTWKWIQEEAAKKLSEQNGPIHGDVENHWRSIVAGCVPFGYVVSDER
jgi:hypothetical protein